jgi:PhnB protein
MHIVAYLNFLGCCEEAFKFYEHALRGKIVAMITAEGTPMASQTPPERRKNIMHARLEVNGQFLMGSDASPEHFQKPQGFHVCLNVARADDAERVFAALSKNGEVRMAIQKTFWAERYGMLIDQFGIPWMVNCEARPA